MGARPHWERSVARTSACTISTRGSRPRGTWRQQSAPERARLSENVDRVFAARRPLAPQVLAAGEDHLFQTPGGLAADRCRSELREQDEARHLVRQLAAGEIVILHAPAFVNQ